MSNKIKQEMDTIPVPPDVRLRSAKGIQLASAELDRDREGLVSAWINKKLIAASLVGIVLVSSVVWNPKVWAVIQKALQYVPGIGMVKEDSVPMDRYVLKKPVTTAVGKGSFVITGMMVDNQMTLITIAGTNISKFSSVKIINQKGIEYKVPGSMATWSTGEWTASYWYQGSLDLNGQVKLVVDELPDLEVTLTLVKADSFESYQDMGETAAIHDVSITAIAGQVGEKARISLVSQVPKAFRIIDYGLFGVHENQKLNVKDEAGKVYEVEHIPTIFSPTTEFYFDLSSDPHKQYTVTIPEVNVQYEDQATIRIPTVTNESVNMTFRLAGFPVTVTRTERLEDNQLRMYLDLHYQENADRSLHSFRIDTLSHNGKLHEQTRELEYLQIQVDPGSKDMKLTFTSPQVVIRGPWVFEFSKDKYFQE